jgi:hypothetical protein
MYRTEEEACYGSFLLQKFLGGAFLLLPKMKKFSKIASLRK